MLKRSRSFALEHRPVMFGLAAAAMIALMVGGTAMVQSGLTAKVTAFVLNVRTGPSPGHPIITQVFQDQPLDVLSRNPDSSWVKIQLADGGTGWVSTAYIEANAPLRLLPVEDPPDAWAEIATGTLNLRAGPGPAYPIIGKLPESMRVALVGRTTDNSWVKVVTPDGATGWISRRYIAPSEEIRNLTVLADPQSWGQVDTGVLNVRSGPGSTYEILGTVPQNERVGLLARNADTSWVYIRMPDGLEGWVTSRYIIPGDNLGLLRNLPVYDQGLIDAAPTPELPAPTAVPTAPVEAIMNGTVSAGSLYVRPGPGTDMGSITTIPFGTVVELLGRTSDSEWLYVRVPGGVTGWVGSIGITSERTLSVLPITGVHVGDVWGGARVTAGALAVRTGPNTTYPQIGTVYQNEQVNLLGRNEDSSWVKIRSAAGLEGWVAGGELDAYVLYRTMPVLFYPAIDTYGVATITAGALNLRAGPGLSYEVLGVLQWHERVNVLGRTDSGAWLKVRTAGGLVGWINQGEVTLDIPLYDLPVVN